MTGYAKKDITIQGHAFSILVKALNSTKGIDISMKVPRQLAVLDSDIRQLIESTMIRGKIHLMINDGNTSSNLVLDKKKLNTHIYTIKKIVPDADVGAILNIAIKLPDIFVPESHSVCRSNSFGKKMLNAIKQSLADVTKYRQQEGKILRKEIKSYVDSILNISKKLSSMEKERLKNKKSKLLKSIQNNLNKIDYDPSRLESEMIYYLEKYDITEERVRLQYHCNFFLDVLSQKAPMGKKLTFISQEILREINTIGSKANDFNIQKIVVLMKEQIDKAKEQLQNIL
tara:strand:- start:241 stop:1098 length:858 start_codon:yes stop_codon:yes gene_type:complete